MFRYPIRLKAELSRVYTGRDESENSGRASRIYIRELVEPRKFIVYTCTRTHIVYTESSRTANQLPRFLEITGSYYFTHVVPIVFLTRRTEYIVTLREISRSKIINHDLIKLWKPGEIYCINIICFFIHLYNFSYSDEICRVWVFYRELG